MVGETSGSAVVQAQEVTVSEQKAELEMETQTGLVEASGLCFLCARSGEDL